MACVASTDAAMTITPASLLQRLRTAADADAWSRLVHLYLPLVCSWGRHWGLQDADVADLSQEVFTQLYRKLPEFEYDARKSFRHWLRTVTLNKWRELARRRDPVLLNHSSLLAEHADPAGADDPWEAEHQRYLATRALQLIHKDFDAASWQACWQTVVEARAPAEVARDLGMSVGAVYAAKSRILRRLRKELEGLW
jgi:RNA polymerase sigma-70 factor (ECF subfamily)